MWDKQLQNMKKRVMHNNVVSLNSIDIVFKMINFVIQKELATQFIIVCLSFIFV